MTMHYPDPRVNPGGFPVATDQTSDFPNDPSLSVDGPPQWAREDKALPKFGPAFVPFIDGRITDLERTVQRLLEKWQFEPVTVVMPFSLQTTATGGIDVTTVPNSVLYEPPAGFTLAVHRFSMRVGGPFNVGSNFGNPFTGAGGYWEVRANGDMIDGGSLVANVGSLPVVRTWGTRDAPRIRDGELFTLFMAGGPTNVQIVGRVQGTYDRTTEG
jgi:hypothetical protein